METLSGIEAQLLSDAEATSDPATAAVYKLRARQVEEIRRYYAVAHSPDGAKLFGFWRTPSGTEDSGHAVKFHWDKGGLMAVEILRTDGQPLRVSDLRNASMFPFRELVRRDRGARAEEARRLGVVVSYFEQEEPDLAEGVAAIATELRDRVEAPRSPYPPEHWESVARVYSEAIAVHDPAPVRAVAEEWNVSRSTARNWVANCRRLRYLPPTEERKAKGNPV